MYALLKLYVVKIYTLDPTVQWLGGASLAMVEVFGVKNVGGCKGHSLQVTIKTNLLAVLKHQAPN